ncbi:MAG: sterol desaturase family protein [Bacteroidota bacterium]
MQENIHYLIPFIRNISRYLIFAGSAFLIFYVLYPHIFSKNKIQERLAKRKDFIREFMHSMQTTIVIGFVGVLFLYTPLKEYSTIYYDSSEYPIWWIPVSVIVAMLIHDTYFYWMHRTVHHPSLFKHIHLVHHKSVNPSPWTSYSFNLSEAILEALIAPVILFLLPMHIVALVIYGLITIGMNVYGHLGYEIAPKWFRKSWLFEIMNTSVYHNLHHEKFKGNYGLYFRIWDRLMKTEHPEYVKDYDKIQMQRFGAESFKTKMKLNKSTFMLLLLMGLGSITAYSQSSIEGKWRDDKLGGTILIYEEDGKYYGQLIAADDPEDNEKIQNYGEKIMILKDFEKENETTYSGILYAPRRKMTVNGILILEENNKLRIKGSYRGISRSRKLKRI